jgi:hypothetical protein
VIDLILAPFRFAFWFFRTLWVVGIGLLIVLAILAVFTTAVGFLSLR